MFYNQSILTNWITSTMTIWSEHICISRDCRYADTALCGNQICSTVGLHVLFSFDYVLFSFGYALFKFCYVIISFGYALFSFGYALFSFDYVLFSFGHELFSFGYEFFPFHCLMSHYVSLIHMMLKQIP